MFVIAAVGMGPQFTDRCHPPPKTPGGCTLSFSSLTDHQRNKESIGDTSHLLDHGKCRAHQRSTILVGATCLFFVRSDGVYLYDADGKQYIDMTSQAVCANMGFSVDEDVIGAIVQQLRTVLYVYPGLGMCEIRADGSPISWQR